MKKIVLITDAWKPQVNGVVTTYTQIMKNLPDDIFLDIIHPNMFRTFKIPGYKEIEIAICSYNRMRTILLDTVTFTETYYHIATEGPLGWLAKRVLDNNNIAYTTAYHTKFPEFLSELYGIPAKFTKVYFDWFHKKSKTVFVPSNSVKKENPQWNATVLDRGYDDVFHPTERVKNNIPVLLYVGRVSLEKNIDAFCDINIGECKKIVVGDGPDRKRLESKYKDVEFVGYKFASDLASYYNMADVTVFPSVTDTFGVVILESMACGTPVAAYQVTGPVDQIVNGVNGYMSNDLEDSVMQCLNISRETTRSSVENKNWKLVANQFVNYIEEYNES